MNTATVQAHQHDKEYDAFVQGINNRFNAFTGPIFETNATGLYDAYLASFKNPAERQYHTCNCCRHFIERFGHLAVVDEAGMLVPAVWEEGSAPAHYAPAIAAMSRLVRRAAITMPFLSSEGLYGTPISPLSQKWAVEFHHFAIRPTAARVYKPSPLKNAYQAAAEKREDFGAVARAIGEFTAPSVDLALKLLKEDHLGNSEAALGQAQFLADIHAARAGANSASARDNLLWVAVANAPAGFCHPRTSMIGTLLEDITAGKTFEQAKAAWAAKMHPLRYQRPQAAPTAGAIAQAEKTFDALGLAPALPRRIARFEEVPKVWEPKAAATAPSGGGIFQNLTPKGAGDAPSMNLPATKMTLQKFVQTVAPTAEQIDVQLKSRFVQIAITTAVNDDAPKLFQWDHRFAWYVWHGGTAPSSVGLSPGWAKVSGITRLPARWNDDGERFTHHGDGLILLLAGARESREAGLALFPSLLRSELHGVRSVLEAHSNSQKMVGLSEGTAVGYDLRKGSEQPTLLRVTSQGHSQIYKIDRWD